MQVKNLKKTSPLLQDNETKLGNPKKHTVQRGVYVVELDQKHFPSGPPEEELEIVLHICVIRYIAKNLW